MLRSRREAGARSRKARATSTPTKYLRSTRVVAGAAASTSARLMRPRPANPSGSHTGVHLVVVDTGDVATAAQRCPVLFDLVAHRDHGRLTDEVNLFHDHCDGGVAEASSDLRADLFRPDQCLVEGQPEHPGGCACLGVIDQPDACENQDVQDDYQDQVALGETVDEGENESGEGVGDVFDAESRAA